MAVPRILLLVPLLLLGMYLPAAGAAPPKPPAGVLGMVHEGFSTKQVAVSCGDTLTMHAGPGSGVVRAGRIPHLPVDASQVRPGAHHA